MLRSGAANSSAPRTVLVSHAMAHLKKGIAAKSQAAPAIPELARGNSLVTLQSSNQSQPNPPVQVANKSAALRKAPVMNDPTSPAPKGPRAASDYVDFAAHAALAKHDRGITVLITVYHGPSLRERTAPVQSFGQKRCGESLTQRTASRCHRPETGFGSISFPS